MERFKISTTSLWWRIIILEFFATCPKQITELLAEELKSLGANIIQLQVAGVKFAAPDLKTAYKICLWSRLANSILYPIANFTAETPEELYVNIKKINWLEHFNVTQSFAIEFNSRLSKITHTQYGAQKTKDAVADYFRDKLGERPNVKLTQPDIKINIHLDKDIATVSLDLSGESLHRRGYRTEQGEAPLKENLAAAILIRSNWPEIAKNNGNFVDLMCGAGTLPIEAYLMASHTAPGLYRNYYGFLKWKKFDSQLWQDLISEARNTIIKINNKIIGFDADSGAVSTALNNIKNISPNLSTIIHIEKRELADLEISKTVLSHPGLVIANPPYGVRLGDAEALRYLYKNIADNFKKYFTGWKGAVFTGNPDLGKTMGLRAVKYYLLFNGPIECKLLLFDINPQYFISQDKTKTIIQTQIISPEDPINMFINRLIKNKKHLDKWAKRENISCYRIYDADLPEYAVAIDIYENYAHVQEYAAPKTIDPQKAQDRLENIIKILPQVLNISPENIFYKTRQKQTRKSQYEKLNIEKKYRVITENQAKYLVDFTSYLDTGLFLDQRILRLKIAEWAHKKHFLNLFAYTGTASVLAALHGASSTTTVDMSATYLQWAKQNFALNGLSERYNYFIQEDCLEWIKTHTEKYDVIFVAPPVFSRSKRMEKEFDLERDHLELLKDLKKNLLKQGKIIFATHKKNFKLSEELNKIYKIQNLSEKLLPLDFAKNKNSFFCWELS